MNVWGGGEVFKFVQWEDRNEGIAHGVLGF